MSRTNPLTPFHNGILLSELSQPVPWHTPHWKLVELLPDDRVSSIYNNALTCDCTIFGIKEAFWFNCIATPHPLLHELQLYETDRNRFAQWFEQFSDAFRPVLGEPTSEYHGEFVDHIRWHDSTLVLDISVRTEVHETPNGPTIPCFTFSFQNSTTRPTHWNNQTRRRAGLEELD